MGLFDWITGGRKRVYSESEVREKITELLLEMVWVDGDAHEKQVEHIVHLLAVRYKVDDAVVRQRVDEFDGVTQKDIERTASDLRDHLPARGRVMLLRDLWMTALSNDVLDPYEERLFHRVADLLGITDHHFLDKCVKL